MGAFAPRRWVGQHVDGGRDGIRVAGLHRDPHPTLFDGIPQGVSCGAQDGQPGPEEIEEARAAAAIYDGPRSASVERTTAGGMLPGSEANWQGMIVPDSATSR